MIRPDLHPDLNLDSRFTDMTPVPALYQPPFVLTPQARILAEALIATGRGDRAAFQSVYLSTNAKLFGICVRICGEQSGAEDVLADVYLIVWRRAGDWVPGRASPISWLAMIARNKAIDWRRGHPRERALPLEAAADIIDESPSVELLLMSLETKRNLTNLLGTLDPAVRALIISAFFDGATYAELAERSAVPLGTVKSKIRRGLAKMKLAFDQTDMCFRTA